MRRKIKQRFPGIDRCDFRVHVRALLAFADVSNYGGAPEAGEYRARQLYKNISMLFLFPVKDGKLMVIFIHHKW